MCNWNTPPLRVANLKALFGGAWRLQPWFELNLRVRDVDPSLGRGTILSVTEHSSKVEPYLNRYEPHYWAKGHPGILNTSYRHNKSITTKRTTRQKLVDISNYRLHKDYVKEQVSWKSRRPVTMDSILSKILIKTPSFWSSSEISCSWLLKVASSS